MAQEYYSFMFNRFFETLFISSLWLINSYRCLFFSERIIVLDLDIFLHQEVSSLINITEGIIVKQRKHCFFNGNSHWDLLAQSRHEYLLLLGID